MRFKILFLAALLSCSVSHPVFAAASCETEVINHVGIGDISIKIEELELDKEGKEVPYENDKTVLPGQRVSKIVRILNEADTAWIRAKLEYVSDEGIQGLSDQMVVLASDQWTKAGDYYYYKVPVERNSHVDFIREVHIPPEWNEESAGRTFSIIVTADAVQADHFTPDFSGEAPWFGTIIETCVHTSYEPAKEGDMDFSVIFEGGAEGLVRMGDDFFSNWGTLMPGDTVTDRVQVKNTYKRPVTIYFRTETIADDRLMEALRLEIKSGDKTIYSGTMGKNLERDVELASLKYGDESELTYTLYVPEELNNQYALSKTKTKWIFSAKVKNSGGSEGDDRDEPDRSGNEERSTGGGTREEYEGNHSESAKETTVGTDRSNQGKVIIPGVLQGITLPQTGDSNVSLYALLLMLGSGFGIVILWRRQKKEEQDG